MGGHDEHLTMLEYIESGSARVTILPMLDDLTTFPVSKRFSMVHAQQSVSSNYLGQPSPLTQTAWCCAVEGVGSGYTQAVRVFTAEVVSGIDWQQPLLVMPRLCHVPAFDSNLDPLSPLTVCG